jgi:ABC-type molybdate transport system substrate-binding protein
MRKTALTILAALLLPISARAEEPLHVFAAGSLTGAVTALLKEAGVATAPPVFGPSGVLRQRIEDGEQADILASADMAQPRRLAADKPGRLVVVFARNSMCALARQDLGLTQANMLDRMLDPTVRLATSTPGADPGGDYAWAVFARSEALHPGAKAALEAKALQLVGGPASVPLVPGKGQVQGVFLAGKADMMLGYCSGSAAVMADVPGLVSVPLPPALTVQPAYGLVVLTDHPQVQRLALFFVSEQGQAILQRFGFTPVGATPE